MFHNNYAIFVFSYTQTFEIFKNSLLIIILHYIICILELIYSSTRI
jgi:hypothetical protein